MIPLAEIKSWKVSQSGDSEKSPLVVATGYDFPFAKILEAAGVDLILVGDSLANVVLGLPSTRDVNMDILSLFVGAVARGAPNTHIMADFPFEADRSVEMAVVNGLRFLALGANSVKLEGPKVDCIKAMTRAGIPVIGHLGLLPQTAKSFKQVGHEEAERKELIENALALVDAGVIGMVLEHLDYSLAAEVTRKVPVPTIGIGAGPKVDGQVLVLHDFLKMRLGKLPPFVQAFSDVYSEALKGAEEYCKAVRNRTFP